MATRSPWAQTLRTARFRAAACTMVLFTLGIRAALADEAATRGVLEWATGTVVTPQQDTAQVTQALTATTRGQAHFVIQFTRPLADPERQALEEQGLRLLNYVGDNAFYATTTGALRSAAIAATGTVRCVLPVALDWKLHPNIRDQQWPGWSVVTPAKEGAPTPTERRVAAYVALHPNVPLNVGAETARRYGAEIRSMLRSINALVVEMPADNVAALGAEDVVEWIEPPLPAITECNNSNRARVGADILQAAPYGLNGSGVSVLVYDGGTAYAEHQDFGGRLHVRDSSGTIAHATHVSGTIGGSGVSSNPMGLYKGMAPGVTIESYGLEQVGGLHEGFLYTDPCDMEADYSQAINVYGVDISNNSIGTNTAPNGYDCTWEGNYGVCSQLIDTIVRGDASNPLFPNPFRVVWANGNERQVSRCLGIEGYQSPYHSTAPPACAKNHITVGALNSNDDSVTDFTSFGPTDDGRLKPDISAPGCQSDDDDGVTSCNSGGGYTTMCGTSMASPTVCGISALLLQDYRAHYPSRTDFRNSLLKVFLAHTAVDIVTPGPDYQSGYGSVRANAAVDFLRSGNFTENQVAQGQTFRAIVIVTPGQTQLKVTLAWDDYPAAPSASVVLVNDLDLRVFDAANNQYYPWTLDPANPSAPAVRTQADHRNNIEQVVIDNPAPGGYRVEVYGYNVPHGPQAFSLAGSPQLINCSSQGTAGLDHTKYACNSTASLSVIDCDLNTDPNVSETVLVTISSTSEPAGETVLLTETAPEAAAFLGSIALSTTDAPGVLHVAPGDTITLTYNDANNGTGQPAVVTASAVVDCTPPAVSGVNVSPINPRDATVNFTTDELTQATVRYGLTCGSLTQSVALGGFSTTHSAFLSGLSTDTTYFFAIDAVDQAGNAATDDNGGACYTFVTPVIPDFFTEIFTSNDNDLDNRSLIFIPNGSISFYRGCTESITALPTDPAGGTNLTLADDSFTTITLTGGARVALYGVTYSTIYVGSNGYLTFSSGDSNQNESLTGHFNQPRVSALFDDLNPAAGGQVSWKQLSDRIAVTWLNVPEWNASTPNTLQIEMFFDGTIKMNYLVISATDGLAGLSAGNGESPDFLETDLTGLGACGPRPPSAQGQSITTPANTVAAVTLSATDDGLPNPPSALAYIITTLPGHGSLTDPGSGTITSVPHTLVGGGRVVNYRPAWWYIGADNFTFKANDGGTPPDGGDSGLATVAVTVPMPAAQLAFSFPLDANPGWTTQGQWAFGHPTGGGTHRKDPTNGHTGTNVYGYNLSGDYTVNMPQYNLTTTPIDCTHVLTAQLKFWRWLGVEGADHASVQVSNDGTTWTTLWSASATVNENAWTQVSYDIAAIADGQPTVYIRWTLGPSDATITYPGWNIDDVEIWGVVTSAPPACRGDCDCNGQVGFSDIDYFVAAIPDNQAAWAGLYAERHGGTQPPCTFANCDANGDGHVNFADIDPFVALIPSACP